MKKTNFLISCASVFALLLGGVSGSYLNASKDALQISESDVEDAIHETLEKLNTIAIHIKEKKADSAHELEAYYHEIMRDFSQHADIVDLHKKIFNWIVTVGVRSPMEFGDIDFPFETKKYSALQDLYDNKLNNHEAQGFINHLSFLVKELARTTGHIEHASTDQDFKAASSTVESEFSVLGAHNFHQTVFDSTCLLMSSLYAIHQKPILLGLFKAHVLDNIRKDKEGNYILKLSSGKFQIFNSGRAADYPDSRLHSDFPMILKVLSFYMAESMRFLGHLKEVESYTISDVEGKDYFFGKPIEKLGLTALIEEIGALSPAENQVIFQKDGSMIFRDNAKNHRVTGDFFVSVATKMGVGGHAVSIYHDGHTWMFYDNLKEAAVPLTNKNMPTLSTSFYVVGNYTIQ